MLGVSESGSDAWRKRPRSARAVRDTWLPDRIRAVHAAARGTDGARRIHAELVLGQGLAVGHQAVERLMRAAGIQGLSGRPRERKSAPHAAATDRVGRQFARAGPDHRWVTDSTAQPTREGRVDCAVVLDACARRVVGWSSDAAPTAALVTRALGMAIAARRPTESTVIHRDQGTHYGSWAVTRRAQDAGLLPAMGAVAPASIML
jgi:transposase InsO family protein